MNTSTKLRNFNHVHLELDPDKILFCPDDKGVIQHEEWRDIPEYIKSYQVSSIGRIKSLRRFVKKQNHHFEVKEKIIRLRIDKSGYYRTTIQANKNRFTGDVHQLIAIAFLNHKPCGYKKVVDHKDNIKTNNFVWNLQIITHRLNASKDQKNGTSKYTGVSWHTKRKRWRASIYHNGKETHLGYFTNEKEAAKAANA